MLLREIPKAKKRVVLAAMILLSGPKIDELLAVVRGAVQRGVTVHVHLDSYNKTPVPHLDLPKNQRSKRMKSTYLQLEALQAMGARITHFGRVGINPYRGRCHVKITVIDDQVFSFGGINLRDDDMSRADFMLHAKDKSLADCLEQLIERISRQQPPLPDGEVALQNGDSILFDGGQPKRSLIYTRACQLASQSKRIYSVTHYVPSGQLARLMTQANTTFYFSRPEQLPAPESWGQAFDEQRYRLHNSYQAPGFMHAKFILFELADGSKALISGSHNFTYRGVAFGTQEIALQSTNEELWQQLYQFMETRIRLGTS